MVCTMLANAEQHVAQARPARRDQRQRQADGEAEQQRGDADRDMAAEIGRQPGEGLGELRAHARRSSARSRSAWRRGVAISSRT